MKSPYVGTLEPNEITTGSFLVVSKEIRQKKTGEPYLSLQLADRTGDIDAKMWDNVAEVMETFDRDDFVKVKGLVQLYQNRTQFTVHKLRRMEDHEVEFEDFFPCSERDSAEMVQELQGIIEGIANPHLQTLLRNLFADPDIAEKFRTAPAAKTIHHACRGGLLEHVLSLCKLCRLVGPHYKGVDLDLLLTGAIVHDIGKIEELSYIRSFGYTTDGQLLGHIVIGLRIVGDKISRIPDFPRKLRALIEHMIISHHGELAFGSPKIPVFEEAMLLHHLDNLDSKMETIKNALKRDLHSSSEFTSWVSPLERTLLRKTRYFEEAIPVPAVIAAAENLSEKPSAPEKPAPASSRPQTSTLFGEKLQAVLQPKK